MDGHASGSTERGNEDTGSAIFGSYVKSWQRTRVSDEIDHPSTAGIWIDGYVLF